MGARVLAALVATALVVGAVVLRTGMDSDDDGGPLGGGGGDERVVFCARELGDVCDGDEVPAATTAKNVIDAGDAPDTWVTAGPWPAMVDEARVNLPPLFAGDRKPRVVAGAPLVAVVRKRPPQCPEQVTWVCLGDALIADVRISAPPQDDSTRLFLRAAFVAGKIGNSDYASNDVEGEVLDWIAAVERGLDANRQFAASVDDFRVIPGVDVFLTTIADAGGPVAGMSTVTPAPLVRIDVYATGERPDGLAERLTAEGWLPPSSADDGLPSPGVLVALREIV